MKKCKTRKSKLNSNPSAAKLWADMEDRFAPTFAPWPSERVVYLRLLRLTRLAGKERIRATLVVLAESLRMSVTALRAAYQRLEAKGAILVEERDYLGHLIRVFLPSEVRGIGKKQSLREGMDMGAVNFYKRANLREMIYAREQHRCFYCRRMLKYTSRGLDHVVPRSRKGDGSYRNVVACCLECNSLKGERRAEQFVRMLGSFGVLKWKEQERRLAALKALRKGELKPKFEVLRKMRVAA